MDNKGWLQIQIYTRKFFRTLKKESIISIFIGAIITLLVMYVTSKGMFKDGKAYNGTQSGMFALICACIWIGIFNSIQLVCREKNDIVKDELDKSLKATSYMAAHFIYQFILCTIQSIIVFGIFMLFEGDEMNGTAIEYLITIFLVMYASDAMAFVISAAVPNSIVAMTVMPLLLLVQLVMAGVLFVLEGAAEIVAYFTVSRWGMAAFGIIGDLEHMYDDRLRMLLGRSLPDMYRGDTGDVVVCWLIFIVFIVVFYFLSVGALKLTTRKIKK